MEAIVAKRLSCLLWGLVTLSARGAFAQAPPVVTPVLSTAPLFSYEDAPATPDADDPAIWLNRHNPRKSLVIGTAKDAGLVVYDLSGTVSRYHQVSSNSGRTSWLLTSAFISIG
jgi:myo-inositol-hexaphosphate 3-phosphohydrolase